MSSKSRPLGDIECGIIRSVNTVRGGFLVDAEALLAAPLKRASVDAIVCQAQPHPCHSQLGAHHHG